MKARVAWRRFPFTNAAEERLIRLVEPRQHVLQDVAVDGRVFGHRRAQVLQLGFLLVARDGDAPLFPEKDALLQRGIVERAAAPQDRFKLALLVGRGLHLELVGFPQTRVHHGFFGYCCS